MKTLYTLSILMLFVGIAVVGCGDGASTSSSSDEAPTVQLVKGTQELCPIMGNPIVEDSYADYDGKRVYFCCPGCDAKFSEDPEKYIKEMEDAGVTLTEIVGMQLSSLETTLCPDCGQVKGSELCCVEGAELCPDCGKVKGSPGCCIK